MTTSQKSWRHRQTRVCPGIGHAGETAHRAVRETVFSATHYSAEWLSALLDYVREVSDNHSIFRALAYYSETDLEETLEAVETENAMLSRYGFDGEEDPDFFLNDLAAEIRKALQARPRPM